MCTIFQCVLDKGGTLTEYIIFSFKDIIIVNLLNFRNTLEYP